MIKIVNRPTGMVFLFEKNLFCIFFKYLLKKNNRDNTMFLVNK